MELIKKIEYSEDDAILTFSNLPGNCFIAGDPNGSLTIWEY